MENQDRLIDALSGIGDIRRICEHDGGYSAIVVSESFEKMPYPDRVSMVWLELFKRLTPVGVGWVYLVVPMTPKEFSLHGMNVALDAGRPQKLSHRETWIADKAFIEVAAVKWPKEFAIAYASRNYDRGYKSKMMLRWQGWNAKVKNEN